MLLMPHHPHGRRSRRPRSRRQHSDGSWEVHARIERLAEPVVLLMLRDEPTHGYDLADRLSEFGGADVDYGNLYRLLRVLEEEGVVDSVWDDDAPGRAKRMYEITDEGRRLLDGWAVGLRRVRGQVEDFLERYEQQRGTTT